MDAKQREEMTLIAKSVKNSGILDYVTAWYLKAIDYIKNTPTAVAFVSTNSISQGEQVGILWGELFRRGAVISFAHRTFTWQSEAKGKAHVHVVIIGFSRNVKRTKRIYAYNANEDTVNIQTTSNISPYLVEGPNVIITNRENAICESPEIGIGNKPIDGGNLLFSTDERDAFIKFEPKSEAYFRKWIGADEFLNGWNRWCLWLGDCSPNELKTMPECLKRINAVKQFRLDSKSAPTRAIASKPTRFHVENFPARSYLVIPRHSSERRPYIPIGLETTTTITGDACLIISDPSLFVFAVLSSSMHMAWMRLVAGRLESRYRYSANIVYNNYPWPQNPTEKQKANVEAKAQAVLDARAKYPDSSLADLYDPLTMPPELVKAHEQLDKAVEQCYRSKPFESDRERVEYLFQLYEQLTAPLTAQADKPKRTRKKKTDDAE